MTHESGQVWTCDTVPGDYGGHPGLIYARGPSTFGDLVAGTEQWTDRLFLVHGDRRISFAQFRNAVQTARTALATFGVRAGDREHADESARRPSRRVRGPRRALSGR